VLRRYWDTLTVQDKPVRFLLSRILAKSGLSEALNLKIERDGYTLHFFNTSLSMTLWVHRNDREEDVEFIRSLLGPGDVYVDIGANIGDLVAAASLAVGPSGRVYAFEAHPRIFSYLRRNISLNQMTNVRPVQAACGEDFSWVSFEDKPADDMNRVGATGINVPVIPAQSLVSDEKIRLIKIDVEGFELFVMKGLSGALERTEALYFEVGDTHFEDFGYTFSDVHDFLRRHQFGIWKFEESGSMVPVEGPGDRFARVQNLVALKPGVIGRGKLWGEPGEAQER
jgi:FkbM family methyltransferase